MESSRLPLIDPIVHAPVFLGIAVLAIGCVYDPTGAFDKVTGKPVVWPLPLDLTRAPNLLLSPVVWALWGAIAWGLAVERQTAEKLRSTRRERFAMVWALMNALWFHTGADVFSGLLQFMPNFTETYKVLNKDHKLPMHHPDRVVMDCVYWFEFLVEAPLALLVFYLFMTKAPSRWIVEGWLHGMHIGGWVGYYPPDIVLGEATHPLISNLDRCIALCWVVIPTYLTYTAARLVEDEAHRIKVE